MIKHSLIKKQFVKIDPGREEAGHARRVAAFRIWKTLLHCRTLRESHARDSKNVRSYLTQTRWKPSRWKATLIRAHPNVGSVT